MLFEDPTYSYVVFPVVMGLATEALNPIIFFLFTSVLGYKTVGAEAIPKRGKYLEKLETIDYLYITCSRLLVIPFAYHFLSFGLYSPAISRSWDELTFLNTIVATGLLFLIYDAVYQPFHRILHLPAFYPYVHKHHHRQMVPTRGNVDAVNVHPFEFVTGEYMHLFSVYVLSKVMDVHIVGMLSFLIIGAICTTLNHSRIDFTFPGIIGSIYHDMHHSVYPFQNNYSQYTILWDRVYGTFMNRKERDGLKPPGVPRTDAAKSVN